MEAIGFVGLGRMGGNMAGRYLDAGYEVYGSARQRQGAQWLIDRGLRWLDTPREVTEASDVVLTSLPDDGAVESVSSGPDGLVVGLGAGKLWIDVSTISPRSSRELADSVRRDGRGAQMLDAPVSGSVPQVQAGTLTIMVGGPEEAYRRVEELLRVLGTPTRIGDNGQGLVVKLAINISLAVQMLAFSEGVLLAERDGVDAHLAAETMAASAVGSPMLKARLPLLLDRPEEAWFDVAMMHKDIRLALAAGEEVGATLPSAGVVDELLQRASDLGYGHRDIASMLEVLGRMA